MSIKGTTESMRNDQNLGRSLKPANLLIVTRQFGASGQPWIWRQVVGFSKFRRRVMYWVRDNSVDQPQRDFEEIRIVGNPAPYDGPGRWVHRLRTVLGGNFYASVGKERRQIAKLIAREYPGVILCYFGDIAMRIVPIAIDMNIPIIAYLHGDFSFGANRWYRASLIRTLRHFSAFVVVTTAERDWLLSQGVDRYKIHVIPCGAPIELYQGVTHVEKSALTFITASRLSEEKGVHFSILAFSKFCRAHPHARLEIFGDGPERADLETLVRDLQLGDRVTFHGYVNGKILAMQLKNGDVFLQHSLRKEGSPVSVAEAMASGLPVISTSVGGLREQVVDGETGFCVTEEDIEGIANAMEKLVDTELRARMGKAAANMAKTNYNSTIQTELLEKVLVSVYCQYL